MTKALECAPRKVKTRKEEHVRRIAEIAWKNSNFKTTENLATDTLEALEALNESMKI